MSMKLMSTIISNPSNQPPTDRNEEAGLLLTKLLNYVKECQRKYGGKTELATEFDNCVAGLCSSLELIFTHGLRTKPQDVNQQNFSLKQVSEIVSNSLSFSSDAPVFWPFVKHHLTKHEQERYTVLRHVWTDTGRGRAWIRATLNERSLERYFHSLFSDTELLSRYYEDWAIFCDQEKNSMLPNMAAGLGSILFAISIDKPELNNGNTFNIKNHNEPIINVTESVIISKKSRKVPQIISFDNEEETDNKSTSDSINIPSSSASIDSVESKASLEIDSDVLENRSKPQKTDKKCDIILTPVQHTEIGELKIVEDEKFEINSPLDETVEISMDIAAVLQSVEDTKIETDQLNQKINSLTEENEKLRQQLKRYVGAIQMLNVDSKTAHKVLADLSDEVDIESDYTHEVKIYENKLVQVAEMHAELMEFNEHLQKLLNQKEICLQKLKKELCDIKGITSINNLENDSYESAGLTSICVPSAFLTGSGSEAHHVYQIYIRAGNDEWNIYRRYNQFHALHTELKKLDPAVSTFDFPPKKSIGKKDASLVEDRRKRLQTYLRKIFGHWPELGNCNNRYLLEQHLSFFKDDPNQERGNAKNKQSSRKNKYPSTNDNHYTGL